MSDEMIDPQLRMFYASAPHIDVDEANLVRLRQAIGPRVAALLPRPGTPPEIRSILGWEGRQVELRIHRPPSGGSALPVIMHIHAGGFVMGSAAMSDGANEQRAARYGAILISVDYSLAPEARYPAQLEDCYAALCWVADNGSALDADTGRIALFGESAGGGLAASLALLARDRGGPALVGQFLSYPMLDCRTGGAEGVQNPASGQTSWSRVSNQFGWQSMRGDGTIADDEMGYFSPALASDLSLLPPAYIAVGQLDLLVDDGVAYATRLIHAGVPTELHIYPGAPHGFDNVEGAYIADSFKADLAGALSRVFA